MNTHRAHFFGMKTLLALLLTISVLGAFQAKAAEQEQEPEQYVKLRLLPEKTTVAAGDEIWIGIEQSIYPHWHTYWINPGDSGSHSKADWHLPAGFEISDIEWPTPNKIPYGPLLNYGYTDNVVLLQKLKVPDTLPEGPITLTADIELLVCKDICIPEFGTYSLSLNDSATMEEDNTAFFEMATAKLPQATVWPATYSEHEDIFNVIVHVDDQSLLQNTDVKIELLPIDWGIVQNPSETSATINANDKTIILSQPRSERELSAINSFNGVLKIETADGTSHAYQFTATPGDIESIEAAAAPTEPMAAEPTQTGAKNAPPSPINTTGTTYLFAFISALLGGLVLNLMPCVFPVLSIKALSLVKISEKEPALARMHGIAYTAGVVLSFLLVAGTLITLQSGGAQIGWGFQLQNPLIVSILAYLLFLVGLNLMGVFEVSPRFSNFGNKLTQGQNVSNSFFTGVLATIVATPCTAPFMGAAIGFALVQPTIVGLTIFAALGFGLALPYLVLSFLPNLQKIMPRPGVWMDRFKEFLAFPMFASSAWLVWVVSQQTGSTGVLSLLLGFILLGFVVWLIHHLPNQGRRRHIAQIMIIIASVAVIAMIPRTTSMLQQDKPENIAENAPHKFGETFSPYALNTSLDGDDPVFVEMTAAWCITCKYNHATSINIQSTKDLFVQKNVKYLIGDWTNQDPEITAFLKTFGRNGVPIYVYYGPRDVNGKRPEPVVLPQVLTPGILHSYF